MPDDTAAPAIARRVVFGSVAVLALVAVFRHELLNRDEATIATVARAMDHGRVLYTGIIDRKPPLMFETVRLFGYEHLRLMRLLVPVAVAAAAWGTHRACLAARVPTAWWAHVALIGGTLLLLPAEDGLSLTFEVLSLPFLAASLWALRRERWLLFGLGCAFAVLAKQTNLVMVAPLLVWVAWQQRRHLRHLALVVIGGLVPLPVIALRYGVSPFVQWVFRDDSGYLTLSSMWSSFVDRGAHNLLLVLLAFAPAAALAVVAVRRNRCPRDVALLLVGGVLSTIPGFRFLPHYFVVLTVPVAALAAPMLVAPAGTQRIARVRLVAAAVAVTVVVWAAVSSLDPAAVPAGDTYPDAVAAIRQAAPADDAELFMWGQLSTLYSQTRMVPAARFPTTAFVTGLYPGNPVDPVRQATWSPEYQMLLDDLQARPPAVVADASQVIGHGDRITIDESPLAEWLTANYRRSTTVDGIELWVPSAP